MRYYTHHIAPWLLILVATQSPATNAADWRDEQWVVEAFTQAMGVGPDWGLLQEVAIVCGRWSVTRKATCT